MSRSHRVVVERRVHNECPKNGLGNLLLPGPARLGNLWGRANWTEPSSLVMSGWSPTRTEPHFLGITSGWPVIRQELENPNA